MGVVKLTFFRSWVGKKTSIRLKVKGGDITIQHGKVSLGFVNTQSALVRKTSGRCEVQDVSPKAPLVSQTSVQQVGHSPMREPQPPHQAQKGNVLVLRARWFD